MNFGLLWIDVLVASLLWVAAFAAVIGRVKRRWIRVVLMCLFDLAPGLLLGSLVFVAAVAKFAEHIEHNWFGYFVSLFSAFLIGDLMILRRASRRQPGFVPGASTWPRGQLMFGGLVMAVVGYVMLCNMDFAFRTRCAILSLRLNSLYLANLPAIASDAQNAAPIYDKAFERLRDDPPDDVKNPPTGNNVTFDPNEPATISFLARHAATIAMLRHAAALPGCRFEQDLKDLYFAELVAGLGNERMAANVLKLHAMEETAHGHTASAIADIAGIYEMSRQFCQRPLLVSSLVGIGIDALADDTLEETLPAVKNRDDLSALHLEELTSLGQIFKQTIRTEESYGIALFGNMPSEMQFADGKPVENISDYSLTAGVRGGKVFRVFYIDLDAYLNFMEKYQDLATQPYYLAREKLPSGMAMELYHGFRDGFYTDDMAPVWSNVFRTLAWSEAMDACAQTAVAMTRFRLDHGTFPTHLEQLVPSYMDAIPTDPFDGHPLRLAIKPGRWIIYSVGPGGIDTGGADMSLNHNKGDIIFTLKQP